MITIDMLRKIEMSETCCKLFAEDFTGKVDLFEFIQWLKNVGNEDWLSWFGQNCPSSESNFTWMERSKLLNKLFPAAFPRL